MLATNATNQDNTDMTKKHKLTKRVKEKLKEWTPREDYEQAGLQEAPHLQDPKQNHFENVKSGDSKK